MRTTHVTALGRLLRRYGRMVGRTNKDVPNTYTSNELVIRTPTPMFLKCIISFLPKAFLAKSLFVPHKMHNTLHHCGLWSAKFHKV